MTSEQDLTQLETLCRQFYNANNSDERSIAEKALVNFAYIPDCLQTCRLLLERANSSYSQFFAATTLTKLVSRSPQALTLQQRIEIKNYILSYLANCPKLETFVRQGLVQLFARLIKIGWFDVHKKDHVFRNIISQLSCFLQGSVEYCTIGVQCLTQVTCEINQITEVEANKSLPKQRKTATSFRDLELFDIFKLSCDLLRRAFESWKSPNFKDDNEENLMHSLLRLAYNCISFDFIGTSPDESSDDLFTVQIPTNWRPAFLNFNSLQLFFDLYHCLTPRLASMALLCIVQIASVRRTLFSNDERAKYLSQLVSGIKLILENPQKLSEASNYHEFCRLLARLKTNYQLGELVRINCYPETIRLIAKFTVTSLQMYQFAPNSIHYLLSLWQRMVASVPYVKASEPHLLETFAPEVTSAFITSRLESVSLIISENMEDPFDDLVMIHQQLDQISIIGRCEYEKTFSLVVNLFDQTAQRYQEVITVGDQSVSTRLDLAIPEGQLTWLVYIIAAAIGGRVSFNSAEDFDSMDGELICRVLQLMNLLENRALQTGCEKLELAMIYFFQQFRKIYVGDHVQRASKVYKRLSDVLGVSDESMVLSVFIRKILSNLKYLSRSEQIINRTLQLLSDLSIGYTSIRKLVKLEEVQFMLNNHTSDHFPFLGIDSEIVDMRCRSIFYTALGRLFLMNVTEDDDKFDQFMLPLTATFEIVGNALTSAESNVYDVHKTKKQLIGLARDLRGLAFAFNSKPSYMLLFDWIYPAYTPVLHRAIEMWYHDPNITTPILKLFAELVVNRSQRLQFDVSSPDGVLLFREASKVIVNYGTHLLTINNIAEDQVYKNKLKGISICFSMLKSSLCGGYVNFGVFLLYGDHALIDALNTFIKLLLLVPYTDILKYPKLSQTYYLLMECLSQDHMNFLSSLEPQIFLYILSSISEGLSSTDTMVCSSCCAALDNLVTYIFKKVTNTGKAKNGPNLHEEETCLRVIKQHPELLQQMLSINLNIVIFEECRNQWSMSRPLLGLILLNEEYFQQLKQNIISNQLQEKQVPMAQWFDSLMEGIERNLQAKNRERFTQNLSVFRRDVNDSLRGPNANLTDYYVS